MRQHQRGEGRIGFIIGTAATSGGSTAVSFFSETLPVLQWCGAVIAIISGALAIVLAILKLQEKFRGYQDPKDR